MMKIFRGNSAELLNSSRGSAFISKPVINLIQPLNASKALGLSSVLDEKKNYYIFAPAMHVVAGRLFLFSNSTSLRKGKRSKFKRVQIHERVISKQTGYLRSVVKQVSFYVGLQR